MVRVMRLTDFWCKADKHFYWQIQSCFVSKANGKGVLLNLLSGGQREELGKANDVGLDGAGMWTLTEKKQTADSYIWSAPFSDADYEKLNPVFRDLTYLADSTEIK